MDPRKSRSVLRYFAPTDSFVRVEVFEARETGLAARPGLSLREYRRMVIEACCPELARGATCWTPENESSRGAEDVLYQLCIDVNPHLDAYVVSLPEQTSAVSTHSPKAKPTDWRLALQCRSTQLAARLERRVVGQSRAVAAVAQCVRRAAAGLHGADRPLASFLFVGRTGTGKTELAKSLARELYGDGPAARLVRVDCSEYALSHEYAKLIGSPPGYVGHEQGGMLTEALRKTPACVVLFDEIEKGHARLHNLLLQILDEGRLTDGRGRAVDFSRAIVCMTSNVGAFEVRRAGRRVGFDAAKGPERSAVEELTLRALEEQFAPEFLARIDERVVFRDLDLADARRVAARLLGDLARRVRSQRTRLQVSPAVARWIAERGFDVDNGARELRRVIQREIEPSLAEMLLDSKRGKGAIVLSIARGAPRLRWAA